MSTQVVIPFRGGCPYRELAKDLVVDTWSGFHVTVVDDGFEPFSRGASLNQAIEQSDADVIVATDADVVADFAALETAIRLARESPGLVQPFDQLKYLDETWSHVEWTFSPSEATTLLGGVNVFSRETWELSGGFLPAFRGWGCEDVAFARQCAVLAGPLRRIVASVTHLWHPKVGAYVSPEVLQSNHDLMGRVLQASSPEDIQEVIDALLPA